MAITKLLASDFGARISISGVWITVSGLNNLVYEENAADIDTTDFDSDGWGAGMPGTRTATITLEGFRLADSVTGERDPGQKAVEKAARAKGPNGRRQYRIVWNTDVTQYMEFHGYAKNGTFGGGIDTAAPWSADIMIDGAPTFVGEQFNTDA